MKLVFDTSIIRQPLTGTGYYAYELARHILLSEEVEKMLFWKDFRFSEKLIFPERRSDSGKNFRKSFKKYILSGAVKNTWLIEQYFNLRQIRQKYQLKKYEDYIFHGPSFYIPPFAGKSVVTVHDLSFIAFPAHHPAARVAMMQKAMDSIKKDADYILTVSDFSKNEIIRYLNWPADRIRTTYLAAADIFHPRTAEELMPVLSSHNLHLNGYSLFVGTVEPRKNIDILLAAYEGIPYTLRNRFPLVICGFQGWENRNLMERIERAEREGWLRHLDYLPHEELPLIMAGARLFLFPSLYEGFGIPPLEALQSGVPAIVSNAASLPEVVGDAAPVLDPHDDKIWQEWIERGLEDEIWREEYRRKGLLQSGTFSWQRCADDTLSAYKNISDF